MTKRHVKVSVSGDGIGSVELDGVDIAGHASGFDLRVRAGEPTRLVMYYDGASVDGKVDAEVAVVLVNQGEEAA